MDEHNVHNFWGASPFVDLGALAASTAGESAEVALGRLALDHGGGSGSDRGAPEPFRTLQAGRARHLSSLAPHSRPAAAECRAVGTRLVGVPFCECRIGGWDCTASAHTCRSHRCRAPQVS